MGADRIFRDHGSPKPIKQPRPRRMRRARLIDGLSLELRRRLAEAVEHFPPAVRCQFEEIATKLRIPIEAVFFYGGMRFLLTRAREQTLEAIREHGLLPGADDDDIRSAIAACRRQIERELTALKSRVD